MLPVIVETMPWTSQFSVDHEEKTVSIKYKEGQDVETEAIRDQLERAHERGSFKILKNFRRELYPILNVDRKVLMARGGSALFGILTQGVHAMAYNKSADSHLRLWIPCRAKTKSTFPGMLDSTVGSGVFAGEDHFDCMVRAFSKEAMLPAELVKERARPVGTMSYFSIRDPRAGGEAGLLQPANHFLYDLELPENVLLKPMQDEVDDFRLLSMGEALTALREGQFKPNSAIAVIDFLIRHGHIRAENEPDYLNLIPRLHRRIHF